MPFVHFLLEKDVITGITQRTTIEIIYFEKGGSIWQGMGILA
jgi:hypothetical protein